MNVILINESSGKSWIKSRRTLSKFLPQIGSRTWAGHITEDGLTALKSALQAHATKNTAVACHRVVSRSRMALCWVVGSSRSFDENGLLSFKTVKSSRGFEDAGSPILRHAVGRWLLATNRLAALFHDLGKASTAFQAKLHQGSGSELLRHDLLSFLILLQSAASHPDELPSVTDSQWLATLCSNPASACSSIGPDGVIAVHKNWLNVQNLLATDNQNALTLFHEQHLRGLMETAPTLAAVLWLVLTHHRLPEGRQESSSWYAGRHVNNKDPKLANSSHLQECLTISHTPAAPWNDQGWQQAVQVAANQALSALGEMTDGTVSNADLSLVLAHYLRPQLILADHLGSHLAQRSLPKKDARAKSLIFANTVSAAHMGDTLTQHLVKVSRWSRKLSNFCAQKKASLPHAEVPPQVSQPSSGRFAWQNDLFEACRQDQQTPSFVVVLAETGAGKTIASAKALTGLQGKSVRANWAIGRRDLTFQTGREMLESAGFEPRDVVVAVGHAHSQWLQEKTNDKAGHETKEAEERQDQDPVVFGSESSQSEDILTLDVSEDAQQHTDAFVGLLASGPEVGRIKEHWSQKNRDMLAAPLLICTIDHLIQSAAPQQGAHANLYMRHVHADLVLDEIDSYAPSDLQAVGKMVLCAGLHMRNVVLMSATATPQILAGLHEAWVHGVRLGAWLRGASERTRFILAANTVKPVVGYSDGALSFNAAREAFVRDMVAVLDERVSKGLLTRKLELLGPASEDSPWKNEEDAMDSILWAGLRQHARHALTDPETGLRFSAGFIEFTTAKSAAQFGRYVLKKLAEKAYGADIPRIKLLVYHAKYPRHYLAEHERYLKALCTRKAVDAPFNTPVARDLLDKERERPGAQDVVVMVATTTLMETGRDFDFDWAIIDPRSDRGLIQAAGRVRRHRTDKPAEEPNISLLVQPLRSIEKPDYAWKYPGVEDYFEKLTVTRKLSDSKPRRPGKPISADERERVVQVEQALPLKDWLNGLDARTALLPQSTYEANRIGYLEQLAQQCHVAEKPAQHSNLDIVSLQVYRTSLLPLTQWHGKTYPFRKSDGAQVVFVPPKTLYKNDVSTFSALAYFYSPGVAKYYPARKVQYERLPDGAEQFLLIPRIWEQASDLLLKTYTNKRYRNDAGIIGVALRCKEEEAFMYEVKWNEHLGFFK